MKQIAIVFILAAVLLQPTTRLFVVADFVINQTHIIKNLCENKNQPLKKCNGKCHLKKQLEEKKEKVPAPPRLAEDAPVYCLPEWPVAAVCEEGGPGGLSLYIQHYTLHYASSLFQPPDGLRMS